MNNVGLLFDNQISTDSVDDTPEALTHSQNSDDGTVSEALGRSYVSCGFGVCDDDGTVSEALGPSSPPGPHIGQSGP
jgi:hypothetical protein